MVEVVLRLQGLRAGSGRCKNDNAKGKIDIRRKRWVLFSRSSEEFAAVTSGRDVEGEFSAVYPNREGDF
jgi:hypothetical protein